MAKFSFAVMVCWHEISSPRKGRKNAIKLFSLLSEAQLKSLQATRQGTSDRVSLFAAPSSGFAEHMWHRLSTIVVHFLLRSSMLIQIKVLSTSQTMELRFSPTTSREATQVNYILISDAVTRRNCLKLSELFRAWPPLNPYRVHSTIKGPVIILLFARFATKTRLVAANKCKIRPTLILFLCK